MADVLVSVTAYFYTLLGFILAYYLQPKFSHSLGCFSFVLALLSDCHHQDVNQSLNFCTGNPQLH